MKPSSKMVAASKHYQLNEDPLTIGQFTHTCMLTVTNKYGAVVVCGKQVAVKDGRGRNRIRVLTDHFEKEHPDQAALDKAELDLLASRHREEALSLNPGAMGLKQVVPTPDPSAFSPTFSPMHMSNAAKVALYLVFADFVAKTGQPKSLAQHPAFRNFMNHLGHPEFFPCSKTVGNYHAKLAAAVLERVKEYLANVKGFTPKLLSAMCDIWKSSQRQHFLGIRITGLDPITLRRFGLLLPLVETNEKSLTAKVESDLLRKGLALVGLSVADIFALTTDTAATPKASAKLLGVVWTGCISHKGNLCVKDCIPNALINSKALDSKCWDTDRETLPDVGHNKVMQFFVASLGRAAFFAQHPELEGLLLEHQSRNKFDVLRYQSYCATRFGSVYHTISRDLRITKDPLTREWLCALGKESTSKRKKVLDMNLKQHELGLHVQMALFPLVNFITKSQGADLSLAEGFILALEARRDYAADVIKHVDKNGFVFAKPGVYQVTPVAELQDDVLNFYRELGNALEQRFFGTELTTEIKFAVYLDAYSYALLKLYSRRGPYSSECKLILESVDACGDKVALERMLKVEATLGAAPGRAAAESPSEPEEEELTFDDEELNAYDSATLFDYSDAHEPVTVQQVAVEAASSVKERMLAELGRFKALRNATRQSDLVFWRAHRNQAPHLHHCFIQSRGISPSTGQLEAKFNIAGLVVPPQSRALQMESMNNMLLIRTNELPLDFGKLAMGMDSSLKPNDNEESDGEVELSFERVCQ